MQAGWPVAGVALGKCNNLRVGRNALMHYRRRRCSTIGRRLFRKQDRGSAGDSNSIPISFSACILLDVSFFHNLYMATIVTFQQFSNRMVRTILVMQACRQAKWFFCVWRVLFTHKIESCKQNLMQSLWEELMRKANNVYLSELNIYKICSRTAFMWCIGSVWFN